MLILTKAEKPFYYLPCQCSCPSLVSIFICIDRVGATILPANMILHARIIFKNDGFGVVDFSSVLPVTTTFPWIHIHRRVSKCFNFFQIKMTAITVIGANSTPALFINGCIDFCIPGLGSVFAPIVAMRIWVLFHF